MPPQAAWAQAPKWDSYVKQHFPALSDGNTIKGCQDSSSSQTIHDPPNNFSQRGEYQGLSDWDPTFLRRKWRWWSWEGQAGVWCFWRERENKVHAAVEGAAGRAATWAQAVPGCRRPSLGAACPATLGGSPGTAAAPHAGSAWRRAPWSLQGRQGWVSCMLGRRALGRRALGRRAPPRRAAGSPAFFIQFAAEPAMCVDAGVLREAACR